MSLFRRKKDSEADWRINAGKLMRSVISFLDEVRTKRGRSKITIEECILERKLIFLLDDLRKAVKNDNSHGLEELIDEINQSWFELYEEAGKRTK